MILFHAAERTFVLFQAFKQLVIFVTIWQHDYFTGNLAQWLPVPDDGVP